MINFPSPASSPWTDPNGVIWEHDGDGWINKVDAVSGGGSLPAGGTTGQIITKNSNVDQDVSWQDTSIEGGYF